MSIQKKIQTILETNDFEQLASLSEPSSWNVMTQDERELLGMLFVKQGEQQLLKGDEKVLATFELASKVAPHCPNIYFRQALAFAAQKSNIRCLTAAGKALEKTLQLDPLFIKAWHHWGIILVDIGTFYGDIALFYLADEKFSSAHQLSQDNRHDQPIHLFWDWGVCWYKLGMISGEAIDFFKSLEKFRAASLQGLENGEFCNDFGNVFTEIAVLFKRKELLIDAAEQYKKAANYLPMEYKVWQNLACTHQHLHACYLSEEYFCNADEYFERATDLNPNDFNIWLHWGELYANAGKCSRDMDLLQASFEKFEKANACNPENAVVMSQWGAAQMLAATYKENFDLLRGAEAKIMIALKGLPNSAAIWHAYGSCLMEFGRYFDDVGYYEQAVERFSHALTLDDNSPLVYHGLALAYFAIGEILSEPSMIEKSIHYCGRAADLASEPFPKLWNDWGIALMKLGELANEKKHIEAAAEKFEWAISYKIEEVHGEDIELDWLYNYGCAMDFLGDFHEDPVYYEKAVQILNHVLQIDPEYSHARYNLALALSHLGELNSDVDCFQKAIDLFNVLLEQDIEDEMAWNDWGLTLLNLGILIHDPVHPELSQKVYEQAEEKFLHAIALGNIHVFYNIACLYSLTNNTTAAMHYIERAESTDALPSLEDLIHDEWLENLRKLPAFRFFISQLVAKQQKDK